VVPTPLVRRVLIIEGPDRLVSTYPSLEAATAAALDQRDDAIHEIRDYAFTSGTSGGEGP
jgi:hypothetical protein